jgi:hypothetical protein
MAAQRGLRAIQTVSSPPAKASLAMPSSGRSGFARATV